MMNPLTWLEQIDSRADARSSRPEADTGRRDDVLERALALSVPSLPEIFELLGNPREPRDDRNLLDTAAAVRGKVFGRTVRLFAPLYYSNVCANDCLYCGFRRSLGLTKRRILTPEEVAAEAAALVRHGHRDILLIASEDPSRRGLVLALDAVRAIRACVPAAPEPGEARADAGPAEIRLSIEIAPRAAGDFAALAEAGVTGYILFQETYDPEVYRGVHPAGPKADFASRLEGPLLAAAGGISRLGLGVLFGLADPLRDTAALIAHARHLQERTGRPVASVSLPRLEPAEGVPFTARPPHPVEDFLWLRILAVLRLALPWTDVIVSTRESIDLRRRSLAAGSTVFSAGSRTDPGGYSLPGESRAQFQVGDERSLHEVARDLRNLGYEPTVS